MTSSVGAVAAGILLLTSCAGLTTVERQPAGEPRHGGTVTLAWNTEAQSVDPVTCAIGIGVGPCQAIYGALLYYDPETRSVVPGMAESFTSQDGKHWTLKLRPGVTFTDGTPFDAAAVAFNWQRALDPSMLSPSRAAARTMSWRVLDASTLAVTSTEVNHQLPYQLTESLAFVGSPTAIEREGADFANAPVGAGPFVFASWARGTELVLERNSGYWDSPRPYLDRFVYKTIPADDQRYNALQADEVQRPSPGTRAPTTSCRRGIRSSTRPRNGPRRTSTARNSSSTVTVPGTAVRRSSCRISPPRVVRF
nr:ABC transporter substrate-binding protein [Nocardia grenadensis]